MINPPIKILLIGEYSIFRSALRMLLETDTNLRVVGEASQLEVIDQIISEDAPDLILVDLPDFGGNDHFSFFQHLSIPVLVLVGQYDIDVYQTCLKIGINGLVLKEEKADTLFKAIEKIHGGEIWFDRTIMGETIRQLVNEKQMLYEFPKAHITNALTEREKQVVDLICKGLKNKGIADQLFITETTVRHHLTSVFNKLEISSRLELVIYAFKNSLVTMPNSNGSHNGNGNGHSMNRQSVLVG
ncbi:MAG: response regulator transcription factor [Acidobacteria bacterium]|nr:response regulator transcription factor [Acidobacteriota bacterium]